MTKGSQKKYWWLCPKGHEYISRPLGRTAGGTNCPYCSNQTSRPEIRILTELRSIFKNVESRVKISGKEVDIFLPDYLIGIEYDGSYFHKDATKSDLIKNEIMRDNKVLLFRLRETPLKKLSPDDVLVKNILDKNNINQLLKKIGIKIDNKSELQNIERYLNCSSFQNEKEYNDYLGKYSSCSPDHSLSSRHPNLAYEWDYDKNFPLIPESFSYELSAKYK